MNNLIIPSRNTYIYIIKSIVISMALICFSWAHAESHDVYAFTDPAKQTEFNTLLKDLRCLVCQGQDLHDSQTQFAETLRQEIHQWVLEGKSEEDILNILVERYDESISYKPSFQKSTYILWIAPFVLFFLVILSLFITIAKRKKPL